MGLTRRVNRGAALLDNKCPGWADRIRAVLNEDPAAFHVASTRACVPGRLFGEFWLGVVAIGLAGEDDDACPVAYRYGFDLPVGAYKANCVKAEADESRLEKLWIAAVDMRTKGN